ncbi:molybdopterin molybdotransferase MoeA [Streptomyces sp. B8F3]|uniref:molybdopterin molybdotransferase MoeA n=1 Tax=Streptomyces sp. B8F3 TaxID=3153573 RepID=UPI00325D6B59
MTSDRRGDRRTPGTGAGAGSGNGSDGETGPRGDEFADALALANDRRDLAAAYGEAVTLAGPPPPAAPARSGTSGEPARTDRDATAGAAARGVTGRSRARRGAEPAAEGDGPSARTGSGRGGDPLDVALGLDARAGREPRDPRGLSWDAARRAAVRSGRRLGAVAVPVAGAYGQVLADPLRALVDLPPFDTSAMDGYAVAGPGPWRLDSAGQGILAGHAAHPPLPDGHAVRIATGARVPPGATGVLRSEHAELRDDGSLYATGATAAQDVRTGQDIRPRGQECRAGVELLAAGERVTPAVLGLAAAAGHDELRVVRRPRVEVLVLGAELLHRGLPREGRIRDALGPMLEPWLRACGAEPFVTRRLGDDAELLYEAVATSTADVVVTTGGTAAGPVDHVHGTLRRLKADLVVDGVAVRPGHPMLLAVLPTGAHVVGLPGNPLAAVSGLLTLAEPLVRVLGGAAVPEPPEAVLTADVKGHPTDTRLVPVATEHGAPASVAHPPAPSAPIPGAQRPARTPAPGAPAAPARAAAAGSYPAARPLHFTGPAMLRGLAVADALAVVPPGGAPAGAPVRVLRLPWAAASAAATTPAGPA